MKKLLKISILAAFILVLSSSVALAQPEVKKADSELQESTNDLIQAKDNESPFVLSERIKAFKDVIDLSLAEAKDLKVKLLSIDIEGENIEKWTEKSVEKLNEVISFYKEKKTFINKNEDSITESGIIEEAKNFKQWREENYIPLQNKIQNFVLMNKEEQILKTANQRWSKIKKDIGILDKSGIKGISTLKESLNKAKKLIEKSEEQNKEAMTLFKKSLEENEKATSTEDNATTTATTSLSSIDIETSSSSDSSESTTTVVETKSSTTSQVSGTSTMILEKSTSPEEVLKSTPDSLDSSIRGLVGSSLKNVKGSYQIFIEMSNFVRELLE